MDYQGADPLPPHVLIFPFPLQGHVNCMLKLAELLCLAGLHVTFLVTDHTHRGLLRHSNVQSHFARYAGFRFETISDGLPEDDPRSGDHKVMEMLHSFKDTAKPLLRELLISDRESGNSSSSGKAIACVVADGLMGFVVDVGEEIGIPVIYFRTSSACHFWSLFCVPKLIDAGELPFPDNNLDVPIKSIPGMDNFLRRRDLSSFFRVGNLADRDFQILVNETLQTTRVQALILNTFEELEGPILAQLRSQLPKIYTIGPLHAHLKTRLTTPNPSNSLWEEDRSCMTWLDAQPSKSVIYVSFGSITKVTQDQLMEFWHGLLSSGKQFLWVIRPDSLVGKEKESQIPAELVEGTRERGHLVGWAPQEEVLAHQAIGAFITHSGWNSTLESVAAGVPMICWPYFGDQQINSRLVGEVLKLGLDMKDTCDRVIIENMVRDLMDMRREEFTESTDRMAKMAKEAISEGGSSYCSLEHLIDNIRLMSTPQSPS